MPVKCAMCPKKNATLDDSNAVKCSKCGLLYHPSCAKRAKINADGWVSFCCYSTAADEVNEVNDLDENSRVLFKLIEAKFNGLEVKFNGLDSKIDNTLITVKEKLCELDDRVLKLEDNNVYLLENVISEINKRNSKECNCIIYKLEDSENAVKKDIELFKNLLACCNDEPSFNINDIKLIRLGKKFKSGVDRPLKVVFPNKDCLHWFFHNKKMIIEKSKKSIIITGDLTNAQRDFRNKVLSEIKLRREKGEDNLFMKYINGIPTIIGLMRNGSILHEEIPEIILYTYSSNTLDEAFQKVILSANKNIMKNYSELPHMTIEDSKQKSIVHMNNLKALLWKNFLWLLKNYLFVVIVFFLPVLTAFMIGYTVGRNPKNLNVGLINYEATDMKCNMLMCNSTFLSCYFLKSINKDFINLIPLESEEEAQLKTSRGQLYATIIIKRNYTEGLKLRLEAPRQSTDLILETSTIHIIYDTTLKGISLYIKYYIYNVFKMFIENYTNACGIDKKVWTIPLKFNSAVYGLDKPNLGDFVCPGILLFTTFFSAAALSCSIMIIERQEGILERFFVMGINTLEIYTAHCVVLCGVMIIESICPLFIYFAYFNYTLKGSIFLVTSLTLLCGFCGLCSGFAISSICSNYKTALIILCGTSTPLLMISGIIWPLESMNYYLRYVAFCFPFTLPIQSLRNILQKGWSINQCTVLIGYIILLGWTLIYILFSIVIIKLKKKTNLSTKINISVAAQLIK
ncbi:hypothetical protein FQA39_LY00985 [Lamprigera yunnana]|nr:hypothetical protein FQA39_LY00985 [Lamprigera yunnana]